MKETLPILFCFTSLFQISCEKESCLREVTYTIGSPVFDDLQKHRIPINNIPEADVIKPGQIEIAGDYIFLQDEGAGIHIYFQKDMADPLYINFIRIPGNQEFFLEGDLLIANNFYDILTINISDPGNPHLVKRAEIAIPIPFYNHQGLPVIGFKLLEISEKVDCQSAFFDDEIYFLNDEQKIVSPGMIPSFLTNSKLKMQALNKSFSR
jgi:hypothetical protein